MKKILVVVAIIVSLVAIAQMYATVSQDASGAAGDFAEEAEEGLRLYKLCEGGDKSACDRLQRED